MNYFLLLNFDIHVGPQLFFSFPEKPPLEIEEIVLNLMDMNKGGAFFEFLTSETSNQKRIINYQFTIPSEWARGGQEILMFSVIFDQKMDLTLLEFRLKKLAENFTNNPNIYKAFYYNTKNGKDPNIPTYYNLAKSFTLEGHDFFQKKIEELEILKTLFGTEPIKDTTSPVQFHRNLIHTFITTINPTMPDGANTLYNIGHRLAKNLHYLFSSNTINGLLEEIKRFYNRYELGDLKIITQNKKELKISIKCYFEACNLKFPRNQYVCKYTEGFLSGIFQCKINESFVFQETECIANGSKACVFMLYDTKNKII